MAVQYDVPFHYDQTGMSYDGLLVGSFDGSSVPTVGAFTARPTSTHAHSGAPTLGGYASRSLVAAAHTTTPNIGGQSSRPEVT